MRKSQGGFGAMGILLTLIIVGLLGTIGLIVEHSKKGVSQSSNTNNSGSVQPVTPIPKPNPTPSPNESPVLTGLVSEGPTAPVCQEGQSCTGVVASHDIVVLDSNGATVATTKTDGNGVYNVTLPQGHYTLKLVPHIGISETTYQVTVGSGTTHYNIEADTGIK